MRLTFFSTQKQSPATIFYLAGLKDFPGLIPYSTDWNQFEVALIMGFREDFEFVQEARKTNPKIKIGILDPRGKYISGIVELIDFFVVDSLEMIDFFSQYDKPIFQYYEYFPVKPEPKIHVKKDEVVIGYHGNKVHLMSMWPGVSQALEMVSLARKVTFKIIYNKEKLGLWEIGTPRNVKLEHVQLKDDTYREEIRSCDIGIVPAFCPIPENLYKPSFIERRIYLLDEDDYIMRFKPSSNAGRIIVFALLGVPVVADMLPSSSQMIQHGKNGFLAYSAGGWYQSLIKLIDSVELRNEFSRKLYDHVAETVDYHKQNRELQGFLDTLPKKNQSETQLKNLDPHRTVINGLNRKFLAKKLFQGRGSQL